MISLVIHDHSDSMFLEKSHDSDLEEKLVLHMGVKNSKKDIVNFLKESGFETEIEEAVALFSDDGYPRIFKTEPGFVIVQSA